MINIISAHLNKFRGGLFGYAHGHGHSAEYCYNPNHIKANFFDQPAMVDYPAEILYYLNIF